MAVRINAPECAVYRKLPFYVGLVSMLLFAGAFGAQAQSLNDALIRAYTQNPIIQSARARLRATDEQAAQALSNWRPRISGTASIGRRFDNNVGGVTVGKSYSATTTRSLSLSISQNIFRGGRSFYEWRRAHNVIRAERARLRATEQDVFLQVVTAYMDVLRDRALLRLSINNQAVLGRQLQATRDRFSVGEVTRTDVSQALARLSNARAERIRAAGTLRISQATYQRLVGILPANLRTPRIGFIVPRALKMVEASARRDNPAIASAVYNELAAHDQVRIIYGELLPTVTVEAVLSRSWGSSRINTRTDAASIVARVTIPLYQSGSVTSRLRAAKQTVFQSNFDTTAQRRQVLETANRAWAAYTAARSSVQAFRSQVRASSIALEGVRQEARAGLRTVLDVLNAEQEVFQARVNLVRARRDLTVAIFQMRAAMGQLTARTLRLRVKYYDELKYYRENRYRPWGVGPVLTPRPARPTN